MNVLQSYGICSACPSCAPLDSERLDLHIGPSLPRMHPRMLTCCATCHGESNIVGSGDTRPAVPFSSSRLTVRRIWLYIRKLRLLPGHDLRPLQGQRIHRQTTHESQYWISLLYVCSYMVD